MEFDQRVRPYDIKFLKAMVALLVKDRISLKVDHKLSLQLFINDWSSMEFHSNLKPHWCSLWNFKAFYLNFTSQVVRILSYSNQADFSPITPFKNLINSGRLFISLRCNTCLAFSRNKSLVFWHSDQWIDFERGLNFLLV